jgi:hypothetical protein
VIAERAGTKSIEVADVLAVIDVKKEIIVAVLMDAEMFQTQGRQFLV